MTLKSAGSLTRAFKYDALILADHAGTAATAQPEPVSRRHQAGELCSDLYGLGVFNISSKICSLASFIPRTSATTSPLSSRWRTTSTVPSTLALHPSLFLLLLHLAEAPRLLFGSGANRAAPHVRFIAPLHSSGDIVNANPACYTDGILPPDQPCDIQ